MLEFRAAIGQGHWSDALERYGGPLLTGFTAGDSPEFGDWLSAEREHLRGQWHAARTRAAV